MTKLTDKEKYEKKRPVSMTKEEIAGYCSRIGILPDQICVTGEGLDHLIWANLTSIPFENLTVTEEGQVPSLEDDALYRKIVEKNRGGYCFEQNKIFYRFLASVGFRVWPIAVRILLNKPAMPAATHRASIALIDGKKYLADVGFGGPGPKGVLELTEGIQCVRGAEFLLEQTEDRIWMISAMLHGEFVPMFRLEETEAFEIDFELMNYYCAKCEKVVFSHTRVLNLCTEDGSIALTGNKLTIRKNGTAEEKELRTEEEFCRSLEKWFGIV